MTLGAVRGRVLEVSVKGVRSPVLEGGPAEATEAVVFVHGNPGVAEDWLPLLSPAGEFTRAIAITMPGYGDADKPRDLPYTVQGYADHLAGALDQLGVTRAHLVLHDFGGPWGLQWAVDHPDQHASTTLINTGVILREQWHALAKVWRTPVLGELFFATSTRSGLRQFMKRTNPKTFPVPYADHLFDLYQDKGTRRAVLQLYRNTPIAPHVAAIAPGLREHPRPTLVVWGAKDALVPARDAWKFGELIPDARVVVYEDTGHLSMLERPVAFNALVQDFLED